MKTKIVLMFVAVGLVAAGASAGLITDWEMTATGDPIIISDLSGFQLEATWSYEDWFNADGIQSIISTTGAGTYTVRIIYGLTDSAYTDGWGWFEAGLYDVADITEPWDDFDENAYGWDYVAETTLGTWHTFDIELTTEGASNLLWIGGGSYNGGSSVVVGAVSLVPEPATMSLLALGGLSLIRRKRK